MAYICKIAVITFTFATIAGAPVVAQNRPSPALKCTVDGNGGTSQLFTDGTGIWKGMGYVSSNTWKQKPDGLEIKWKTISGPDRTKFSSGTKFFPGFTC